MDIETEESPPLQEDDRTLFSRFDDLDGRQVAVLQEWVEGRLTRLDTTKDKHSIQEQAVCNYIEQLDSRLRNG